MSSKRKSFSSIVLESLGWPLFWGLFATFAFYLLVFWGFINSELVSRYFAGHPVEYIETTLFFIGLVALVMKAADLAFQFNALPSTTLPTAESAGDETSRAAELIESLNQLPARMRATYLARRLTNSLRHIDQSDSADGVDAQLRHLSDMDAERSHEGYALVRMIVWATPMLGFLGTVIGITLALGNLSPEALINAPQDAMQGLLAGLSIAFDTTALALSLSIILMFVQYLVRQVETQLLVVVDRRTEDEIVGRFQQLGTATDPNVSSIKKMSLGVIKAVEKLVERQAELWQASVESSQGHWLQALQSSQTTVHAGFQSALSQTMAQHAESLTTAEELANQRAAKRWSEIQHTMQHQAETLNAQREEISKQGEVMLKVLAATGEVANLETTLNQNLSALAGSKNFEDTVMSLSAAIQLLNSRLGVAATKEIRLQEADQRGRAA